MVKKLQTPFANPDVAVVFASYPQKLRTKLMLVRQLIYTVAAETEGVGEIEETLKWGQPSYLTSQTKSGSTIRIDQIRNREDQYAIYFHCQTSLVDTFKEIYGNIFKYEGNRSIIFSLNDPVPVAELSHCISLALRYHRDKKLRKHM